MLKYTNQSTGVGITPGEWPCSGWWHDTLMHLNWNSLEHSWWVIKKTKAEEEQRKRRRKRIEAKRKRIGEKKYKQGYDENMMHNWIKFSNNTRKNEIKVSLTEGRLLKIIIFVDLLKCIFVSNFLFTFFHLHDLWTH